MPKYIIRATYEYETKSPIEAPTQERAERVFLADLNAHYSSTVDLEFILACDECEKTEDDCECDEQCDECGFWNTHNEDCPDKFKN